MPDPHVVVAGAGPVGCVASAVLATRNINVTLLEASPELPRELRASTFHPATLDLLDRYGVVDEMIGRGLVAPRFAYRDRRKGVVAEFDLGTLADVTDHPFRLQCEQYKLCEIMLDRLAKMANVTVRFDAEVVGAADQGDAGVVEITGTDGDDVICVPDTSDVTAFHVIDAKAGNDTILAGDGIDWIRTGAGDDKVYSRGGGDTIHTGEGSDTVYGGAGFDTIHALSLVDTIIDDPGGYELIIGTAGSLPAAPQTQDDRAHARVGQVVTIFVLGNDFDPDEDLDSSTLRITRSPTMGTARLVDIDGNAALQYTAPLVDITEVIVYEVCDQLSACSTAEVTVTVGTAGCTIVGDTLEGTPGDDVICGGAGDDTIYGNGGDDIIIGGDGNDTLYGGDATRVGAQDGDDIILGAAGDDIIHGGAGDDTIHAGTGNDSLRGGNGDDILWGDDGDDTITAGAGDDTLRGGPGGDTLWGNTQDDTLWGGPGDDTLNGQGHNDELYGGTGNDTLHSGNGDDIAHGDSGDDTLDGGNGTDYLNGGTGNDTCTRGHTTTHCESHTANRGTSTGQ